MLPGVATCDYIPQVDSPSLSLSRARGLDILAHSTRLFPEHAISELCGTQRSTSPSFAPFSEVTRKEQDKDEKLCCAQQEVLILALSISIATEILCCLLSALVDCSPICSAFPRSWRGEAGPSALLLHRLRCCLKQSIVIASMLDGITKRNACTRSALTLPKAQSFPIIHKPPQETGTNMPPWVRCSIRR